MKPAEGAPFALRVPIHAASPHASVSRCALMVHLDSN